MPIAEIGPYPNIKIGARIALITVVNSKIIIGYIELPLDLTIAFI